MAVNDRVSPSMESRDVDVPHCPTFALGMPDR
jgi:hypothetical protein